jgi:DNA-binding transcriptional regulator YiaG
MKLPKGVTPRKFARALQAWRERKAFSQRDAAELLGISKRTLENWEQERATPRGYAVVALLQLIDSPAQIQPSTHRKTRLTLHLVAQRSRG